MTPLRPVAASIRTGDRGGRDVVEEEGDQIMSQSRSESVPRPPLARLDRPARALDAILGASPDLVFLCGPDGSILDANHAAASAWGLARAEILGKSWHELG